MKPDNIEIQILTSEHVAATSDVVAKSFSREPMSRALGLSYEQLYQDFAPVVEQLYGENMSFVAIDKSTGDVVGTAINTDYTVHPPEPEDDTGGCQPIFAVVDELYEKYPSITETKKGEIFHVFILAVKEESGAKQVAQNLMAASYKLAQQLGYPKASGETTGPISQYIAREKYAGNEVSRVAYVDFEFKGSKPFVDIKEVDACLMYLVDIAPAA